MGEVSKKLIQTFFTALIVTGTGIVLLYSFSSFDNSQSSLEGMVSQETIEKKLERQNENYYNELYKRYEKLSEDVDDYQTQTNKRFDYVNERLDQILRRLDGKRSNSISIDNSSFSNSEQ